MKLTKTFYIFLILTFPILSSAEENNKCTSWGCISTLSDLYTNADGVIYIGTPLDETLANCTPVAGVYFAIEPTHENKKEMYASLLAAYMGNKKIQLRIKEGSSNCDLLYVRLSTQL